MDINTRSHVIKESLFEDNPLKDFIFLDYEATGLIVPTNPIEIGVAKTSGYAESWLIKPAQTWETVEWHPKAIEIHGLTENVVKEHGHDCRDIAMWLNDLCRGKIVVSDNPDYETYWTNRLFLGAGLSSEVKIYPFKPILGEVLEISKLSNDKFQENIRSVEQKFKVTHRAIDDALFWAMVFRGAVRYPVLEKPKTFQADSLNL